MWVFAGALGVLALLAVLLRLRYAWEAAERSRAEKAARQQAEGQGLDPASDGLRDDISPRDGFDGIEPGGAANPAGEGEECNGMLPSARGEKGFSLAGTARSRGGGGGTARSVTDGGRTSRGQAGGGATRSSTGGGLRGFATARALELLGTTDRGVGLCNTNRSGGGSTARGLVCLQPATAPPVA